MPLLNFPLNPVGGDTYPAPNGVTYTFDDTVGTGVWLAEIAQALTIVNPGTITGTAQVGATLTYTTGAAAGGTSPYNYSWVWKYESTNLQVPGTNVDDPFITIPAGAVGDRIYVTLTVTDATSATASANTTPYPAAPATIQSAGITNAAAPNTIPGTATFNWADGPDTLSASGCIEFSVNGGVTWQIGPQAVTNTTTVVTRWVNVPASGTCGDAPDGTNITGDLTTLSGLTTTFNLLLDRVPNAFTLAPSTETTTPLTITAANPTFTLTGSNAPSLIWGTFGSTGSAPQYSVDNGVNWATIPNAPGTAKVNPGATVKIRFTTGSAAGTETFNVSVGASTAVGKFQSGLFTVTVATAPFPGTTFLPAGAPNASPPSVNAVIDPNLGQLDGIANTSWNSGTQNNVISTGDLQFTVNGGGVVTVPTTLNNLDSVDVFWNPATVLSSPDLTNLTGTLTNGTYTNTFSFTVDKDPLYSIPPDSGTAGAGTTVTIPQATPYDYNSPIPLYCTPGSNPMTNFKVSINTLAAVTVPTSLGTALTLNPGDTVEFFGDIGTSVGTVYSMTIIMGSFSGLWAETATGVPAIAQPTLVAPTGSPPTLLSPQYNSPSGIELITSTYSATGGAGAQTASTYEVYKDGPPSTFQSTNTVSAVSAPAVPAIGASYGGGYFAGQIVGAGGTSGAGGLDNSGTIYNIVVAPVTGTGSQQGQYGGSSPATVAWRFSNAGDTNPNSQNENFGKLATEQFTGGTYPMFDWCVNGANGPRSAGGIGGFTDWYIPAKNELAILYFFLKPNTNANNTSFGSNPQSVAPYTPGTNYGSGFPNVTGASDFITGGTQAFAAPSYWWSSTESSSSPGSAWTQLFDSGAQATSGKSGGTFARAIRRVASINGPGSSVTLTIAGADTDGFTVGMKIAGSVSGATGTITAINGTSVTITQTSTTQWAIGDKLQGAGTAITGSPYSGSTPALPGQPSVNVPMANLVVSSNYFWRAKYSTNTPSALDSPWSTWNQFATASSFALAPGTPMGGGYFAGQIVGAGSTSGPGGLDNSGTIYNLIVAPVGSGQTSGLAWAPGLYSASLVPGAAQAGNLNYGKAAQDSILGIGAPVGTFPALEWAAGLTISGFNDWYLPARYELSILYFFLKPDSTLNIVGGGVGSTPVSVSPYTPNTAFTSGWPVVTTADGTGGTANFLSGGSEAFNAGQPPNYMGATETAPNGYAAQGFSNGNWISNSKTSTANIARVVRRIPA